MRQVRFSVIAIATVVAMAMNLSGANWPQFRGPGGLSIGEGAEPPTFFGPESNVVWRVAIPAGNSSPIVWSNKIFFTAYDKAKIETLCVDRRDGEILWRQTAPATKFESAHKLSGPATPTPVTDGERVIVYFGSFGLLAYDLDGREQWRKPMNQPLVEFGSGSSPVIVGELVIQLCDQDDGSFLLALDKRTGKQVWRAERPEFRRGFSTPLVWRHDGAEELVVPGSLWLTSYELKNGKELWRYSGTSRVPTSSPVIGDGLLFNACWNIGGDSGAKMSMPPFEEYAADHDANKDGKLSRNEISSPNRDRFVQMDTNRDQFISSAEWQMMREMFDKAENAVISIRPGGRGEITKSHLVWKSTRSLPYVSSPLFYRGRVYTVKNGGLFSCYDATTGNARYQDERLDAGGDYYSSAVVVGEKIYLASQQGIVLVIAPGDDLKVLARNRLGEQLMATPAIVDGTLYLRTASKLLAIGSK
jgi:outer membrane protein assembly factor BamB